MAVFLQIQELLDIGGSGTLEVLPSTFWAKNVADTKYWVPDADIGDAVIDIRTVEDIASTLQVIPQL